MSDTRFKVRVHSFDDSIEILYMDRQVLYWDVQEWINEPGLVFAIAEACRLAYEDPNELYDRLVLLGKV